MREMIVAGGFSALVMIPFLVFVGLLVSALSWADVPGAERGQIIALVEKADSALAGEDAGKSIEYLLEAYQLAESANDYVASAVVNNRVGEIYEQMGRYQEALTQYEQGMQTIATRQAGAARVVDRALAALRGSTKEYTAASGAPISTDLYRGEVDDWMAMLDQVSPSADDELGAVLTMNAGNMYLQQNQYKQAEGLYENALAIARSAGLSERHRQITANLAWSAIKQQHFDQAQTLLAAALGDIDDDSQAIELRRALLAVGVYQREKGEYQQAIAGLHKAVTLYQRAGDDSGQCQALTHLATAYFQRDELAEAKRYYLDALKLNRELNNDAIGWHVNGGLAKTYYRLGDLEAALEHYEHYLNYLDRFSRGWYTDQGKVGILEDHAAITNEYAQVALDLAEKTGDFGPARKAIEQGRARALQALLEARQARTVRETGSLPAGPFLYGDRWPDYRIEFAGSILTDASSPQAQMAWGAASAPRLASDEAAGPAPERPRTAPPQVTFLETYVLADRTAILVKHPDGSVNGVVVAITAESLAGLITQYRQALDVVTPRGVAIISTAAAGPALALTQAISESDVARRLYRQLIKPVTKLLPQDPQETVVIVPNGSLWLLSFAALRDDNGGFFGDQHVLTYAVSESTWQLLATRARTADHRNVKAWLVGNPDMPPAVTRCGMTVSMDRLPGAEQEAQTIATLLGPRRAELFTGVQADRLRFDAWHQNFSVLHLATHGFVCPEDPLSSFLVLSELSSRDLDFDRQSETVALRSDSRFPVTLSGARQLLDTLSMPPVREPSYAGLLDARTIIGEFYLDADLVTLSACQTGLGQLSGEGVIGFTRAFLAAGSRSLLVSLWRVDDQSTKDLMVSFYHEYLEHGNKGLALQRAMMQTRAKYPEPRYWAGFTLVGLAE